MPETTITDANLLAGVASDELVSGHALISYASDTIKGRSDGRYRKKLTVEEAISATRMITMMLGRYELSPTVVLVSPGRATDPGATYKFFLTTAEMEGGVTRPKGRLSLSIIAHTENAKLIARHARAAGHDVTDEALLDELAGSVPEFLEQFRFEISGDPAAELAADINKLAPWLDSPRRGIEIARFMNSARRDEVVFDRALGEVTYQGPNGDWEWLDGNAPHIPLMLRGVAVAEATVSRQDPDEYEGLRTGRILSVGYSPKLTTVGKAKCYLTYKVGLAAALAESGRHLQMEFTLDPVTYVGVPNNDVGDAHWMTRGYSKLITYPGIPVFGRPYASGAGDDHWFEVQWPKRILCPIFEKFVSEAYDEGQGWDEGRLWMRQSLPVTAETCALIFGYGDWGDFERMRGSMPIDEETVLPLDVMLEGGVQSWDPRHRFENLLYSQSLPNAASLLLDEALKRINAYEGYKLKSASGARQRKLSFRARMRR